MTQAHKTPGNLVKVKSIVFEPDNFYFPYCKAYKDHVFEVLDVPHHGHVLMRCLSGLNDEENALNPLEICLHDNVIQTLSPDEVRTFKKKK